MKIKTAMVHCSIGVWALGFSCAIAGAALANDVRKPDIIAFGASAAEMAIALEPYCRDQAMKTVEPPQIPGAAKQSQLDCAEFNYFGAPRLAEFVFADDALTIVWILTDKSEESALITAFKAAYGDPSHDTPAFTAFADSLAAVRKDVPEALYYSQSVAAAYRGWFDQQAAN